MSKAPRVDMRFIPFDDDPIIKKLREVHGEPRLGSCLLDGVLGRGGMGAVFSGHHVRLGVPRAVKCLALPLADDGALERFRREARLSAELDHPNLVRVFDVDEDAETRFQFIEMELVAGKNLRELVEKRGAFDADEAVRIMLLAAEGVAAAHRRNVVHRDIKPANILVTSDGRVKVADLGLARAADETRTRLTQTGLFMGTPKYAAPEQCTQLKDTAAPADVYALGATLWFLLSGRDAMEDGPPMSILYRVVHDPFPDLAEIVPGLDHRLYEVISRATAKSEEDRFGSAEELAAALAAVPASSGAGVPAPSPTAGSSGEPGGDTRPTVVASPARARPRSGPLVPTWAVAGDGAEAGDGGWAKEICEKGTGMAMVLIPSGEFDMGSPEAEVGRASREGPVHRVRISRPFYLGKFAVTQGEWRQVMGSNPSRFKDSDRRPVERVSWNDARELLKRLDPEAFDRDRDGDPDGFRLPSEAEWEYACRAGTQTPFHFGETISTDQANYDGNYVYGAGREGVYRNKTIDVGSLNAPNAFGLHDMHGNVWEWCQDAFDSDAYGARSSGVTDPRVTSGSSRVLRGGSWGHPPRDCRSAFRDWSGPSHSYAGVGFRCSRTPFP